MPSANAALTAPLPSQAVMNKAWRQDRVAESEPPVCTCVCVSGGGGLSRDLAPIPPHTYPQTHTHTNHSVPPSTLPSSQSPIWSWHCPLIHRHSADSRALSYANLINDLESSLLNSHLVLAQGGWPVKGVDTLYVCVCACAGGIKVACVTALCCLECSDTHTHTVHVWKNRHICTDTTQINIYVFIICAVNSKH